MVTSHDFTHRLRGEDFASSGDTHAFLVRFSFFTVNLASKQTFYFNSSQNEPRQNSKQMSSKQL